MRALIAGALLVRTLNAQIIDVSSVSTPVIAPLSASDSATSVTEASPLALFDEPTPVPGLDPLTSDAETATPAADADLLLSASASAIAGAEAGTLASDTPEFDVLATASESGAIPVVAITGPAAIITPVPVETVDDAPLPDDALPESSSENLPGFEFPNPSSTTPLGGVLPFEIDASTSSGLPTASGDTEPLLFGTADVILSTLETSTIPTAGAFLFGTADVILSTLEPSPTTAVDGGVRFGSLSTAPAAFGASLEPTASSIVGAGFGSLPAFESPIGLGIIAGGLSTTSGLGGLAVPTQTAINVAIPTSRTGGRFGTPGTFVGPPQPGQNIPASSGKGKGVTGLSGGDSNVGTGVGGLPSGSSGSGTGVGGLSGGVSSPGTGIGGLSDGGFGDGGVGGFGAGGWDTDEDDHPKRPGPPGWEGDDNGSYEGEEYDPSEHWKNQNGKKGGKRGGKHGKNVGKKGKGWHTDSDSDSDSDSNKDCPKWCLESDSDSESSDEELYGLGKKKKKVARKGKAKSWRSDSDAESDTDSDEPGPSRSDKFRRLAVDLVYRSPEPPSSSGLSGFSWPGKKGEDTDDDDDIPDWLSKLQGKKGKKKGKKGKSKPRCPKRCLGKGKGKGKGKGTDPPRPGPTTLVTSTTTVITNTASTDSGPGPNVGTPGPDASNSNTLAGLCPGTCNPFQPADIKCDTATTGCVTTGGTRYYCTCRAGYRFDGVNPADFGLQFKVDGQPYVYGASGRSCNTLCRDSICSEVPVRQQCA